MSCRRLIGSSGVAVVANAVCCDESSSPKKTRNSNSCTDNCLEQSPNAKSASKERDRLPGGNESPDNSSNAKGDSMERHKSDAISENLGTSPRRRCFLGGAKDVGEVPMSKSADGDRGVKELLEDTRNKVAANVEVEVATNVAASSRQEARQGQSETSCVIIGVFGLVALGVGIYVVMLSGAPIPYLPPGIGLSCSVVIAMLASWQAYRVDPSFWMKCASPS